MTMQIRTSTTTRLARRPAHEPALLGLEAGIAQSFHFWLGASGERYVHTVYSLVECPVLPKANYVMVRRQDDGSRVALRIATATSDAPSLNLAEIRQRAARLGANEIHVHLLAEDEGARDFVARDLQAGQFAELGPEPTVPVGLRLC